MDIYKLRILKLFFGAQAEMSVIVRVFFPQEAFHGVLYSYR